MARRQLMTMEEIERRETELRNLLTALTQQARRIQQEMILTTGRLAEVLDMKKQLVVDGEQ
jgi:hypothetical protein